MEENQHENMPVKTLRDQDQFFLSQVGSAHMAPDFSDNVNKFINKINTHSEDEDALTAGLLVKYLRDHLTKAQLEQITQLQHQLMASSKEVQVLIGGSSAMKKTITEYFTRQQLRSQPIPYEYWRCLEAKDHPFVGEILKLEASDIVNYIKNDIINSNTNGNRLQVLSIYNEDFLPKWINRNGGLVVERFEDPKTQTWGIWMSTKNLHYDPSKVS